MNKEASVVYVVTMYRRGDHEKHSYVLGVFDDRAKAEEEGRTERLYMAGKYDYGIKTLTMNTIYEPRKWE